jgi:phenylpropionate dioxygenase-like ring-hydroxylating dioxygenase large terminal subunit
MRAARDGYRPVAVARLASGRLVVVDDRCPHDGGRISDGFVDGEHIVCARHGWELALVESPSGMRCERACKLRE